MFELVLISNVFIIVIIFVIVKCFCYKVIVCRIPSIIQGLSLRGDVGYRSCPGNSVFLCPGEVGRLLGQIIPSNGGFISGCYIVWMLNIGSKVWVVWMWELSIIAWFFYPKTIAILYLLSEAWLVILSRNYSGIEETGILVVIVDWGLKRNMCLFKLIY